MIKVNELRIGNYIERNGVTATVEIINGELDEVSFLGQDFYYADCSFNLQPIQITEEWLLKFGFEKIVDNEFTLRYDLKKDARFDYFFPKHNLKTFGMRFQGSSFFDVVKSVHQLQNLYFALTGKELTTNQ